MKCLPFGEKKIVKISLVNPEIIDLQAIFKKREKLEMNGKT